MNALGLTPEEEGQELAERKKSQFNRVLFFGGAALLGAAYYVWKKK